MMDAPRLLTNVDLTGLPVLGNVEVQTVRSRHEASAHPRWTSACHAAGHAVAAFCVGWTIRRPGIVLVEGGGADTNVLPDLDNWSLWKYVHVAMAGPYSEPDKTVRSDARRLDSVRAARNWIRIDGYRTALDGNHSIDGLQAAGMTIRLAPKATDEQIADLVKQMEFETFQIIHEPAFVARVERVAALLADNGEMSPISFNRLM
jgi:hypothetical protein